MAKHCTYHSASARIEGCPYCKLARRDNTIHRKNAMIAQLKDELKAAKRERRRAAGLAVNSASAARAMLRYVPVEDRECVCPPGYAGLCLTCRVESAGLKFPNADRQGG